MVDRKPLPAPGPLHVPANRPTIPGVSPAHTRQLDIEAAGKVAAVASNAGNALKVLLGMVLGAALSIGSGYAWAKSLAPKAYVDDQDRAVRAESVAVDRDLQKQLSEVNIQLAGVVAALKYQATINEDHGARLRDAEARKPEVVTGRGR